MTHRRKVGLQAVVVALSISFLAHAENTVWLVRPLYPGQEALVERTEKALDKLMPADARKVSTIGLSELQTLLKSKKFDALPCFSSDARCADPIDALVTSLAVDRVVLIQAGQDDAGFKYRVSSYEPAKGKPVPASASNAVLEKALLGAVAKVVPAASTLEVKSTPSGATVFIDDVKVGTTPLTTQVLPGERVVRFDLKLHQPTDETLVIPIRGKATVAKTLEKVAARIIVTAMPPGAAIAIDGQVLGRDKVDRGILPGTHTLRITADAHKAYEQQIVVKADEQLNFDKSLQPLNGGTVGTATEMGPMVAKTDSEAQLERKSYLNVGFETATLLGSAMVGIRFGSGGTGRTANFTTPGRQLIGAGIDYGNGGKLFGLNIVGVAFLTNADRFAMDVGFRGTEGLEVDKGITGPSSLDPVRINLVALRLVQPYLRFAFWRFMVLGQIGPELRLGQITGTNDTFYKDGFLVTDFFISVKATLRFTVWDGLFVYGSGNYAQYLIGQTANTPTATDIKGGSSWGIQAGVGYAF
jgi:PEGA domain